MTQFHLCLSTSRSASELPNQPSNEALGLEVTRVTRDAKSTLESTVTKYLLTVDFLGQAWTCSGIACMKHTCDSTSKPTFEPRLEVRNDFLGNFSTYFSLAARHNRRTKKYRNSICFLVHSQITESISLLLPRVLGLVQSCRWEEDDYVETLTSHLHFSKPSEFYAWRSNAKSKSIHITVNFLSQDQLPY